MSFELSADVTLNIVCFSVKGDTTGRINREIVMDLHESGVAAPSTTKIGGRPVIPRRDRQSPDAGTGHGDIRRRGRSLRGAHHGRVGAGRALKWGCEKVSAFFRANPTLNVI